MELGPLTLLIGANASGKSNAIEALQILSWLARGRRLDDVFVAVSESELLLRGGIESLLRRKGEPFRLACRLGDADWNTLEVGIQVGADGMRINSEKIENEREMLPLYQVEQAAHGFSHDIAVSYNNFSRGGQKPRITCTDQQAVFTQLITPARFAASHKKSQEEIPQTAEQFIEKL